VGNNISQMIVFCPCMRGQCPCRRMGGVGCPCKRRMMKGCLCQGAGPGVGMGIGAGYGMGKGCRARGWMD